MMFIIFFFSLHSFRLFLFLLFVTDVVVAAIEVERPARRSRSFLPSTTALGCVCVRASVPTALISSHRFNESKYDPNQAQREEPVCFADNCHCEVKLLLPSPFAVVRFVGSEEMVDFVPQIKHSYSLT